MPKRSKAAPVNYQVPFSQAPADVSRTGTDYGDAMSMREYMQPVRKELNEWRYSPEKKIAEVGKTAVDIMNPIPGTVEAANAWGEFGAQPSWKGAGSAALKTGMAGLDWLAIAEPALKGAGRFSKMARLGRY